MSKALWLLAFLVAGAGSQIVAAGIDQSVLLHGWGVPVAWILGVWCAEMLRLGMP